MKKYTLYLDESETKTFDQTTNSYINPHFCMAGIVVADDDIVSLANSLNQLKTTVWSDIQNPESVILHQMKILEASKGRLDVNKHPEYVRFLNAANRKMFYSELKKVFAQSPITIIGCCISEDKMKTYYCTGKNKPDQYLISMQFILENYCHFLCNNKGHGGVIYESRDPIGNERLRDKYYHMKLMGSMYMSKAITESRLLGLDFVSKNENNPGLQIADFVPHGFARHFAGTKQPKHNIFSTLQFHRYDGGNGIPERYGMKYMP